MAKAWITKGPAAGKENGQLGKAKTAIETVTAGQSRRIPDVARVTECIENVLAINLYKWNGPPFRHRTQKIWFLFWHWKSFFEK